MNNEFEKSPILSIKLKKFRLFKKDKFRNRRKITGLFTFLFLFLILISLLIYYIIFKTNIQQKFGFKINNSELTNSEKSSYQQDDLTLVTAYYKIKSKHTPEEYLRRIKNFVLLNKSIVFLQIKNSCQL